MDTVTNIVDPIASSSEARADKDLTFTETASTSEIGVQIIIDDDDDDESNNRQRLSYGECESAIFR